MADDKTKSGGGDTPAKAAGSDSADKGKRLNELLDEFEKSTQKPAASRNDDELTALKAEVAQLRTAEASRSYRKEMDEFLIPAVKGDLGVHPKLVEAWINEQADANPTLKKLWETRNENRREFEAAVKAMKPEFEAFAEKEGLKEAAPTDDGKRKAAVRTARVTPSAPRDLGTVDLNAMSDQEFALHKAEVFRAARAGQLQ
jgi:hypothetical protein